VPREKRRSPHHGTATSTSTRAGRVQFENDDPLKRIGAREYLELLLGEPVPSSGMIRCPLSTHEDREPSFKAYEIRWVCFGCGAKGDIYDLAAELWGLDVRRDFRELKLRLLDELLGRRTP
jgi:hypothetical protein